MVMIVKGSVVDMDTDAIVNAANESLLGGGGGKLTPPDVIIDHVNKLCGGEEA